MVSIEKANEVTLELLQAMMGLVGQLNPQSVPPFPKELEALLNSECATLFIAREGEEGPIAGMATLILYRVPTGLRGYIEDVVVYEHLRGKGIGEALTRACLDAAQQAGAPSVSLTSNPGRVAANGLYQKMGFEQRKTNVYRYLLRESRAQEK